jgi:hypothetical protein
MIAARNSSTEASGAKRREAVLPCWRLTTPPTSEQPSLERRGATQSFADVEW